MTDMPERIKAGPWSGPAKPDESVSGWWTLAEYNKGSDRGTNYVLETKYDELMLENANLKLEIDHYEGRCDE